VFFDMSVSLSEMLNEGNSILELNCKVIEAKNRNSDM
jgi:hypothetical protein